jgi:hypothetical protein
MSRERKLLSFVDTFVASTENTGAPVIFRKWTALSLLAAAVEQKVWVKTSRPLFPNMYVFLIAHPGVGKTRAIMEGKHIATTLESIKLSPVSMTFASLVDALTKSSCEIIRVPEGKLTYNSMYIMADELGAFMPKYEGDMIDGLAAFYDPTPYTQTRRTNEIDITIKSPQLNILSGSTPQNLLHFMPERAWGQGFTSRVILVFSDERIVVDDFADHGAPATADLAFDLKQISGLYGRFNVTKEYQAAVNHWRATGELPVPDHPKLVHYVTRRRVHIYKLSMLASINRDNALYLTEADFFTALTWLSEVERHMPDIFKAGATNADSMAMEEIIHFIELTDVAQTGVSEHRIVSFACERLPLNSVSRIIDIMESAGQITCIRRDKHTTVRYFTVTRRPSVVLPLPGRFAASGSKTGSQ